MTVPGIYTLHARSAAHSRRAARPATDFPRHPGQELAGMQNWPLRSYLQLRPAPESVRSARLHTRTIMHEWCLSELTDTVQLLVSEIITNAVRASAHLPHQRYEAEQEPHGPRMRLWLTSDRRGVLIQVWDGDHHQPVPQTAELDSEAGRGLLLVEELSAQWGCYMPDSQSGKIVWALCARPGDQETHHRTL